MTDTLDNASDSSPSDPQDGIWRSDDFADAQDAFVENALSLIHI